MFLDLQPLDGGSVAFGGNQHGKIVGIGKVGKKNSTSIDNVFYVKRLKHNLLSISQFCDSGYSVRDIYVDVRKEGWKEGKKEKRKTGKLEE